MGNIALGTAKWADAVEAFGTRPSSGPAPVDRWSYWMWSVLSIAGVVRCGRKGVLVGVVRCFCSMMARE
eukprot:1304956-Rhodomonas_salina.3